MAFPKRKVVLHADSLRQVHLMKQMARNAIRACNRPMTETEREVYGERGKKLVVYIACLNDALIDLEMEMEEVGKFRHDVKKRIKIAQDISMKAHTTLYDALAALEGNAGLWYNDRYEASAKEIRESVYLEPPHKAYSIVMALLRLIKKLNASFGRFVNRPSESCENITKLMKGLPADDKQIDMLVDNHIKFK